METRRGSTCRRRLATGGRESDLRSHTHVAVDPCARLCRSVRETRSRRFCMSAEDRNKIRPSPSPARSDVQALPPGALQEETTEHPSAPKPRRPRCRRRLSVSRTPARSLPSSRPFEPARRNTVITSYRPFPQMGTMIVRPWRGRPRGCPRWRARLGSFSGVGMGAFIAILSCAGSQSAARNGSWGRTMACLGSACRAPTEPMELHLPPRPWEETGRVSLEMGDGRALAPPFQG